MKKTITTLMLMFGLLRVMGQTPQTVTTDFENLTLAADTFYEDHNSTPWHTANAIFRYSWDTPFNLWGTGFSYTNKNNAISSHYSNDHAAITGKGYNNSDKYVTYWEGYVPGKAAIVLKAPNQYVNGFYVTNTTYSYKTMKNGGGPARAFGDTAHAHAPGMQPGNYPDWFKLSVYAYKAGTKKADSVEFYLADYRFSDNTQDYIVNTWKWVDCTKFGMVDSVTFKMFSSDIGVWGINNPTYFSLDNFTTSDFVLYTGLASEGQDLYATVSPNPFNSVLNVRNEATGPVLFSVIDISGKAIYSGTLFQNENSLDLSELQNGIYFLRLSSEKGNTTRKIIKN